MRPGLPGMLSETMTRAPLFSLISLTWDPPLPMIIDASWVTMRQRMWILAAGGAEAVELVGAADVVAEASPRASAPSPDARSAESDGTPFASGVDAAVSSARGSIFTSPATEEWWLER